MVTKMDDAEADTTLEENLTLFTIPRSAGWTDWLRGKLGLDG